MNDGSLEQLKAEIEAASPYNDGWTRQHYAEKAKSMKEQNVEYARDLRKRLDAEKQDYVIQLCEGDIEYLRSFKNGNYAATDYRPNCELFARITEQILDTKRKV
jgi:hypothetical protein